MRRALFGPAGPWLVRVLCGWELVALCWPRAGVPTVSQVVGRHRLVGVLLIAALGHHWFVEQVVLPMGGTNGPANHGHLLDRSALG